MSDDWKVGDLAECIDARITPRSVVRTVSQLVEGRVYRVCKLRPTPDGIQRLGLNEFDNGDGTHTCFYASRFRKIRPDEHEDCEPEFVTLLESFKRKVKA